MRSASIGSLDRPLQYSDDPRFDLTNRQCDFRLMQLFDGISESNDVELFDATIVTLLMQRAEAETEREMAGPVLVNAC